MAKFLLLIPLIFSFYALSAEQYYDFECRNLQNERDYIQKRLKAGYGVREGNYLNERDRELFTEIAKHCKKPIKREDISSYSYSDRPVRNAPIVTRQYHRPINTNYSGHNKIYYGEKRDAWDKYYKMPDRCRAKNLKHEDFVFCAEDKADKRDKFEEYWLLQMNANRVPRID